MDLRKWINEAELSRSINYTKMGNRFENSDFARSVEMNIRSARNLWRSTDRYDKTMSIGASLILPISSLFVYGAAKVTKVRSPYCYKEFSTNPDLVLNHQS